MHPNDLAYLGMHLQLQWANDLRNPINPISPNYLGHDDQYKKSQGLDVTVNLEALKKISD